MKAVTFEPGTHTYRHGDGFPVDHVECRGPGDVIIEGDGSGFWMPPYPEFDPIVITVLGEPATLEFHPPHTKPEVPLWQ